MKRTCYMNLLVFVLNIEYNKKETDVRFLTFKKGVIMKKNDVINMGIGFVTGRKNFRKVLKTYMYRWKQASVLTQERVKLHLFVAYDLDYNNTQVEDYINIKQDILNSLDSVLFISRSMIQCEIQLISGQGITSQEDAEQVFDNGYAGKRNAVLYYALKAHMDYLIFLDDDEYPLAVTNNHGAPLWSGQDLFRTHLKYLADTDITNGYHCGYISPIPHIEFNEVLTENDFRMFIEAISNDIIEWDNLKKVMGNGGVTYADTGVLVENEPAEVSEIHHAKFISGSNLGINLTAPQRVSPFFNPPKARGEDTFLSTCLQDRKVLRVPCYTFHDGFSVYSDLLDGVLPIQLKRINITSQKTLDRFYKACVGWVRYKPLYLLITSPDTYERQIGEIQIKLELTIPKLCDYLQMPEFHKILTEFKRYSKMSQLHYQLFQKSQRSWKLIREFAIR